MIKKIRNTFGIFFIGDIVKLKNDDDPSDTHYNDTYTIILCKPHGEKSKIGYRSNQGNGYISFFS